MKRWIRRLVVLVVLAGAAYAAFSWLFRPRAIPVTVFRVASGRVEDTVTNSRAGTLKARRRATLSPETAGRVSRLSVRRGDHVRTGQLLLRLDTASDDAQIALLERSVDGSQAASAEACQAAELAGRDLERARQLAREQLLPADRLDQAESRRDMTRAACDAATARVAEAKAALNVARVAREYKELRAPFDGVVAEVSAEVGEWVTPAPPGVPIPPVIEIIATGGLYVSAPLDEVDVARVHVGQRVRITLDAFPGRELMGRLVRIAPYVLDVQEQNRTFDVEVEFDDQGFARGLRPGTSADVEIILDARDDVLRIPSYGLIEGTRVLVVHGSELASVTVETGLRNWEYTEITSGLRAGALVVVSLDRPEVTAGALVRVESEQE
ncbi:MAG: efflux RND transporter periplasmic adaptor subunit [Acidobacteriota bacterium]